MKFIVDLDGTLVCPKQRIYSLFCELSPDPTLPYEAYWALKMAGLSNVDILERYYNCSEQARRRFHSLWMATIEDCKYLAHDSLIPGTVPALELLRNKGKVYLCTARQRKKAVEAQLEHLGIPKLFDELIVTGLSSDKVSAISKVGLELSGNSWLIGDTGKDVGAAKTIGVRSCAVSSGVMNYFNLKKYEPDAIFPCLMDFSQSLEEADINTV